MLASTQITMNKKIIIILSVVLLIIIIISVLLLRAKQQTQKTPGTSIPESTIAGVMPGILRPTTEIAPGELEVISVSPPDMSKDLVKTTPIEIVFSRPLTEEEVEFMISPELSYTKEFEGNKLIITPTENFEPRTLYTYRIKILSDIQKIRLYTFTTAGDGELQIPDTAPPDDVIKAYDESVRVSYPDIYLYNHTPYESKAFAITGTFSAEKNQNVFNVLLKGVNKEESKAAFLIWLQSLDLTDEQIAGLDIIYE